MRRQSFQIAQLTRRDLLKYMGGAGLLLAGGCSNNTATAPLSGAIGTGADAGLDISAVRVAFLNYPDSFDPARARSTEAVQCAYALYDALTYIRPDLTPEPLLAVSWQTTADRLAWSFELQRDVRFHNGALMTAADVAYTFNRILDPALESPIRLIFDFIEQVEVVDEYAVRFVLSSPNADLPLLVGTPLTGIVPNNLSPAALSTQPVGVGAWRVAEMVHGQSIRFARNTDYWNQGYAMQFDTLEYRYFSSIAEQVEAVLANEIDLIPDVPPPSLGTFASNPSLTVQEVPSARFQAIVMRADIPPFDDPRVREALRLCMDREAIQQQVLAGRGVLASDQPIAPVHPFQAELAPRPYDPEQARQLLLQAGYPNGLQLSLITSPIAPGLVEMAQLFQTMALPAGIEIEVISVPADVYLTDYAGRALFHAVAWGMRPSVDETLTSSYHSKSPTNYSHYVNPELDRIIEAGRSEPDAARRAEQYRAAQELIMREAAMIIPCFIPVLMAIHKSMEGFSSHPTGWLEYSGVHRIAVNDQAGVYRQASS